MAKQKCRQSRAVESVRQVVWKHAVYPIAGRLVDRCFRWIRREDEWEEIVSASVLYVVESTTASNVRYHVAKLTAMFDVYLGADSREVLLFIDEVAETVQKCWQEAN